MIKFFKKMFCDHNYELNERWQVDCGRWFKEYKCTKCGKTKIEML